MEVVTASCAVALTLCPEERLGFHKVVSERARQRDTHSHTPLPSFLGLAAQAPAGIRNGAFRNETRGERRERRERRVPFDIVIHKIC